jgi:ubiquinone/menaquinone biosynthesis C-methylase UbiE
MSTNRELALELYRRMAPIYDRGGAGFDPLRRRAIDLLQLRRGEVVIDVGCGTGLSLPILLEVVGPEGQVIAIDQSHEMLAKARRKVQENGWLNVSLIEAPIEDAEIPVHADAALFALSHDIMRTPKALENVMRHLRTGGRLAVVGTKWAPWWAFPIRIYQWLTCRGGMTTYEGLSRPWSHLQRLVPGLRVVDRVLLGFRGEYYLAYGAVSNP